MSLTTDILFERALAKEANRAIVADALLLLEELHTNRCTINYLMDMNEAMKILEEAVQALSEL